MSLSSRNFQLHHPWLWIFGSVSGIVLSIGLLCLPVWGWIQLRFSPLQRHYLSEYLQSSLGVVAGSGPEHVQWIEKRGPGRDWEIAEPEDLLPTRQDYPPFQLTPAALAHGWTDLGYNTGGTFEQRDIRDTLQTRIFNGHSFLFFILQPFELFLVGFLCWKMFDHWREQQARKRGARWGMETQFAPWDEDLALFLKQLGQGIRGGAVQTWRWIAARQQSRRQPAAVAVAGATVAPAGTVPTVTPVPRLNVAAPVAVKAAGVTAPSSPKVAAATTDPSQAAAPKAQLVKSQPEPKSAPSSPFGKPVLEGEPQRKWDVSQWID